MFPLKTTAGAAALAAALAGCATGAIDANLAAARQDIQARAGVDVAWLTTADARSRARVEADDRLRRPLSQDDAVRLALAWSPALQGALFDRAADSADATQSARLPNPVFELERLASGGSSDRLEITRALTLPLLDLVLMPARSRQARDRQMQARLQLASDILRAADDARRAWVQAVAARQALRYAGQVEDAAEAGATLARRMEAAGNFSALERARQEVFSGEAADELAGARRADRMAREALVRALGLDAAQAASLELPDTLPAPPPSLPDDAAQAAAMQAALDRRLDLQLARAVLEASAREQGLVRLESVADGLTVGAEHRDQRGEPRDHGLLLSVPLPLFDPGDAARAGARARQGAALARAGQVAVDAASQLRESWADYRESWALAGRYRDAIAPLQAAIGRESLLRYNGMLASVFDLLAEARERARTTRRAIEAQRDFWLADAALQAASDGRPSALASLALVATDGSAAQ